MHQTNIFQKFAKNELDYSAINNALCAFGNIKFDLVDVFEKKKNTRPQLFIYPDTYILSKVGPPWPIPHLD